MTEPTPQDQLAGMITGYWASQMVYVPPSSASPTCWRAAPGPRRAAQATGTHAPSLYRLLRGLASLGVFSEGEGGRFSLTPLAELLRADVPGSRRPQCS